MKIISKGLMFSVAFAALLAAHNADAQTANSSSGSTSAAGASSSSGSGAAAIVGGQTSTNNFNSTTPANTTNTTTLNQNERVSGGTNSTLTQQGHTTSDVTVRTTPTVYAPPVSGGNPCTLAVSAGASFIGWGAAAGGTFVDKDCADRQKIAMIHNAGYQQAARELMCNDKESYMAFRYTQTPCAVRQQWEPNVPVAAPRPVMQPMPTPIVTAAPKTYPRCNPRLGIVDNCAS